MNPFKFGLVGSTDSPTAMTAVEEDNFFGKHSGVEPGPHRWEHVVIEAPDPKYTPSGGLSEDGLPAGDIPTALPFFSASVEAGHFLFVGAVLLLIAGAHRLRVPFPRWAGLVPPYAIGTTAMFWFLQRTASILGL